MGLEGSVLAFADGARQAGEIGQRQRGGLGVGGLGGVLQVAGSVGQAGVAIPSAGALELVGQSPQSVMVAVGEGLLHPGQLPVQPGDELPDQLGQIGVGGELGPDRLDGSAGPIGRRRAGLAGNGLDQSAASRSMASTRLVFSHPPIAAGMTQIRPRRTSLRIVGPPLILKRAGSARAQAMTTYDIWGLPY